METWKPVLGYEGCYEVSDRGRVRSVDRVTPHGHRRRGKLMKLCLDDGGYQIVGLSRNRKRTTRTVHQLVLEAFVGPKPDGHCACHYPDRSRTNNCLKNLRWDSYTNNFADREKHGRTARGSRHGITKLTEDIIPIIRRDIEIARRGKKKAANGAMREIQERYGVSHSALSHIASRRYWGHVT